MITIRLAYLFYPALFFSSIFLNNAHADEYQHVGSPIARLFSVEEHQNTNQIWKVKQHIDGRMLFATGNGLSIWDGENW